MRTVSLVRFAWMGMVVVWTAAATVQADVVHLKNGSKIEGQVTDLGDAYQIVQFSVQLKVAKDQVEKVEAVKSPYEEYLSRQANMDPNQPESHLAFGNWCLEKGWKDKYVQALYKALQIDSDFLPARKALGFEKFKGRWMTPDEIKFEEGFVKYQDRWVRPERAEDLAKREAERERQITVQRGLNRLVLKMATPSESERQKVYEEMLEFGRQYGVMNIEDIAGSARGYYDGHYAVQAMIESQYVTLTVNVGQGELQQPIRTLPIVQTIDAFGILHTVSIQLPAMAFTGASSTIVVPAGSGS